MKKIMLSTDHGRAALVGLSPNEQEKMVRSYSLTYGKKTINPLINQRRSTTQTALCKAVMKRVKEGKKIPTPKTMLEIIIRKGLTYKIEAGSEEPTPENKQQVDEWREIFDWYVGDLVGKVTGHKNWGTQRYYGHLATYAPPDDRTNTPYVSAGSEAFVVLMFENCEVKWAYMVRCIEKGVAINDKSVKMDGHAFSDRCSGQNCYGGWSNEGRERFKYLRDRISR